MTDPFYGRVHTDQSNDIFVLLERYGTHDKQYAVLLSVLIGMAKAMQINLRQVTVDVRDNWSRVPAPEIVQEH